MQVLCQYLFARNAGKKRTVDSHERLSDPLFDVFLCLDLRTWVYLLRDDVFERSVRGDATHS